ncbi:unnamed protein product [Cyclocybe aegerita]|uniref:CCHC-type domain-containing protein n=1 Tax=Cyclocybe aegerita TaxID=1973307 RepID=A0A8S0X1X0_CYCAE|nr:unnamed protein product [Cyclocybe aegerita]
MNTIEEMVAEAKAIEAAEKTACHYEYGNSYEVYTNHTSSHSYKHGTLPAQKSAVKKSTSHQAPLVPKRTSFQPFVKPQGGTQQPRCQELKSTQGIKPASNPKNTSEPPRASANPAPGNGATKCYNCGQPGHFLNACPQKKGRQPQEFVRAAHTEVPDDANDTDAEDKGQLSHHESAHEQDEVLEAPDDDEYEVEGQETKEVEYDDYNNEYYARNSESERFAGMHTLEDESPPPDYESLAAMTEVTPYSEQSDEVQRMPGHKRTLKSTKVMRAQPVVKPEDKACLITYTKVNDHEAWTLWDAGSTTTSITPLFTDVADVTAFPLLDPFMLQLGTVGSQSKITHGAYVQATMPGCDTKTYVDICNLDRYDMVIGTPFMQKNKVVLDFGRNIVQINGQEMPALQYPEDVDPWLHRARANDRKAD